MTSWLRILFLIALSGLLAYIGDILGYRLGRKRLSLFTLRPRVTAQLIAVSTGILIMILTMIFASILSSEVRIALFNLDSLVQQEAELRSKNSELLRQTEDLRKNISGLQNDINDKIRRVQRLEEELANKKKADLAFTADEIIGYRVLDPDSPDDVITSEFSSLITQIISISKGRGAIPRTYDVIWNDSSTQREKLIEFCHLVSRNSPSLLVVFVRSQQNVFQGEEMGKISFTIEKNRVVIPSGFVFSIDNFVINGEDDREEIALFLRYFVSHLELFLQEKGMVETAFINELVFYDSVNYIHSTGDKFHLVLKFNADIFLYDPEIADKFSLILEKTAVSDDSFSRSYSQGQTLEIPVSSKESRGL